MPVRENPMLLIVSGGAIWDEPSGGATAPVGPQPDPDPTNITPYFHFGTRSLDSNFSLAINLNPDIWVRRAWGWGGVEPTQNAAYQWGTLDSIASNAATAGVTILGVLSQAPAWATGGQGAGNKYPTGHQQEFYDFCRAAAARYVNTVTHFEIMNEPDLENWTAAQVKEILIGAGQAIHAGNPNAKVVGCVFANSFIKPLNKPITYSDTIFDDPLARSVMDYASFHYYCRPNAPEVGSANIGPIPTILQQNRDYLVSKGFTKPFWITENGWPTVEALPSLTSEADQARFLVRMGAICASEPQCGRYIQFQLNGNYSTPGIEEAGMGLTRLDSSFKPAWFSYKTLLFMLDETLFDIVRQAHANSHCWVMKYRKVGKKMGYLLWTDTGTDTVTLTNLPAQVRMTTLSGTQTIVNTTPP